MNTGVKILSALSALLLFACVAAFSACSAAEGLTVRIMVEDGENFSVVGDKVKAVRSGSDVSFDIRIDDGCYYSSNNCGAEFADGKLTLRNVTAPKTIVLDVAKTEYAVRLESADGMTVGTGSGGSDASATLTVPYGEDAVFDIEIDERHIFAGVFVRFGDGSDGRADYADGKITVYDIRSDAEVFVWLRNAPTGADEAVVRLLDGAGYTVEGASEQIVKTGGDASFSVSVWDGYSYVSNNCGAVYDDGAVTLRDVAADQDIVLVFRPDDVRTEYYEHGRVDVSDADGDLLYSADADGGYTFTHWLSEGELYSYANDLTVPAGTELEPVFASNNNTFVTYHANGGHIVGSSLDSVTYLFDSPVYLYPAAFGEWFFRTFEREGYAPLEYNTEPDGSGNAYSLGSRIFEEGRRTDLYVIWERETPEAYFDISYMTDGTERTGVELTRYTGADPEVVVPAEIDGLPVVSIADGCFAGSDITRAVITKNVRTVERGAFRDCRYLETVYMCDSVEYVYNESFSGCDAFSDLRMIAVRPPVYADHLIGSTVRRFELLVSTRGEYGRTNIIFYGGSSIFQGIDGHTFSMRFNQSQFRMINGGQNAYVSGPLMLDLYSAFMKKGDVLVFVPEYGHEIYSATWSLPAWIALEEFYDAFRYIDIRDYGNVFGSYYDFQHGASNYTFVGKTKQLKDGLAQSYEDYNDTLDEWFTRGENFEIVKADVMMHVDPIDFDMLKRLVTEDVNPVYNDKVKSRGITMYFACYGLWEYAFPMDDEDYAAYESWLKENLAFTYISDYRDHMFSEDELTDSISHLTREAAREHSNIYAEELMPYMRADGYPV